MKLSDFKKIFYNNLSEYYPKRSLRFLYKISIINICKIQETEILINERFIEKSELSVLKRVIEKLRLQMPIEYIFKETEFLGNKILLNNKVFIPRPETEELTRWVLAEESNKQKLNIIDLCSGSGCIALSLAQKTNHQISAVDKSQNAVKIANKNFQYHNVKVKCINQDILRSELKEKYDVMISNPPYVPNSEEKNMKKNVLSYEPKSAIFVQDKHPLLFYDRILYLSKKYLNKKGAIYFEIHQDFANNIEKLIKSYNFKNYIFKKDFYNKYRMVKIKS